MNLEDLFNASKTEKFLNKIISKVKSDYPNIKLSKIKIQKENIIIKSNFGDIIYHKKDFKD